ncbi:hypothetical protein NP493_464g01045 [Ridgeia piscesae]|uniref:MIT domain-containing protein n=1 Tax=Ridgeia piscesae TaxID=27915 RepID=A0AAD9NTD5_RIDPI|nr:hypothetical protein NP493_464g01045 [Ridgeia piscesae]
MSDKEAGIEASAVSLLKRAVEMDTKHQFSQALVCYQEGIQLLMDVLKVTKLEAKRQRFRQRITEYMDRAEKLKAHIDEEKETGKYHEQVHIENNSVGHGYERLFGRFLDSSLTAVEVEDPYIMSNHQLSNFLRFCELLVKSRSPVCNIKLLTKPNNENQSAQQRHLDEIGSSLRQHNVCLEVEFSRTLHDREIRLNNGWIIKIGRGLDYFKAASSTFAVGYCDYDLRPCHETTVDIFHRKHTKPG